MTAWEYLAAFCDIHGAAGDDDDDISNQIEKWLDELGQDGWELVTLDRGNKYRMYATLKRPGKTT